MKFDWYNANDRLPGGFRVCNSLPKLLMLALLGSACWLAVDLIADETVPSPVDLNAELMVRNTMTRLALNDAFDAKLRQRIWACGRAVVGVGHYEQSGSGTGQFSLEMTIHDGDSRQTMKQISDGKLCWHRVQIGTAISVHRVDIGRIDEYQREHGNNQPAADYSIADFAKHSFAGQVNQGPSESLPARLLVGGLVELLDRIASDYDLRLGKGTVEKMPVWVLRGALRQEVRSRIHAEAGRDEWASLCPVEVRIAIAATADANGFGAGLPTRIEFFGSPPLTALPVASESVSVTDPDAEDPTTPRLTPEFDAPAGPLISLLEIYAMRKIDPSPEERFRFVSDDRQVTFTNDTKRYLDRISE